MSSHITHDSDDERAVEEMLGFRHPEVDNINLANILLALHLDDDDDDIDAWQVEQHVFCPVEGTSNIPDLPSKPLILPFPSIDLSNPGESKVAASLINFFQIILPHLGDTSLVPIFQDNVCQEPSKPAQSRRQRGLQRKVDLGIKHAATVVASAAAYADWPTTNGAWKGLDYRHRADHEGLRPTWGNRTIGERMAELKFRKVPYEGRPTWLVDKAGIAFGLRTEILKFFLKPWKEGSDSTLLADLNKDCDMYMEMCGDRDAQAIEDNCRGLHWAMIIGADRQNKTHPFWTKFHLDHLDATMWLLHPERATARLIQIATRIMRMRFPMLAARVDACEQRLLDQGVDSEIAKPLFGLWYNYCINGARPAGVGVDGVNCQPHTDGQNLAVMMCVLFIYGNFNWHEKAWLVLWEAGLIVQLPIGVLFYYPSALFIHFNIDIADFHRYVYTTTGNTPPTPDTGHPLHGVKGRGSIVFFNQASMFQIAEVGLPIGEAKKQGLPTAAENDKYMAGMPTFELV